MKQTNHNRIKLDFANYIVKHRDLVDEYLEKCLISEQTPESNLIEAMRYSVFAGGKRLRPILVFAGGDLIKDDIPRHKFNPFAAAIEMIHTYSLIHDDLPAMDDDDLRRGKPSCHKQFGEGTAILAGDALLTLAFEVCSKNEEVAPEIRIKVIRELASAAGYSGMVGGQFLDLGAVGNKLAIKELSGIHHLKTAKLIAAPLIVGALVAEANEEQIVHLEDYGINLGLAFQIVDDILDVTGDEKTLGKKIGSDEFKDKVTYPSICGIDDSRNWAKGLIDKAKKSLESFGVRNSLLLELADFVLQRSN
ncbi:polyprenyl synthetase family protein [bacterium]|nr:polyprenyl synthetase family protein [bacterium]